MSDRLVSIASFWNAAEAHIARNRLLAEGIPARIGGEETAVMIWHVVNSIGGVKLLVMDRDTERCGAVFSQSDAGPPESWDVGRDEDEDVEGEVVDASSPDATADRGVRGTEGTAESPVLEPPGSHSDERVLLAERAFRCTVFGLIAWPLKVYGAVLFARAVFSRNRGGVRGRWKLRAVPALVLPDIVFIVLKHVFGFWWLDYR